MALVHKPHHVAWESNFFQLLPSFCLNCFIILFRFPRTAPAPARKQGLTNEYPPSARKVLFKWELLQIFHFTSLGPCGPFPPPALVNSCNNIPRLCNKFTLPFVQKMNPPVYNTNLLELVIRTSVTPACCMKSAFFGWNFFLSIYCWAWSSWGSW